MNGESGELVLGRYRLEHPIGEGGFGRVYLARQVALGREVAVKSSHPEERGNPVIRERFRREALLVAGINHPHVVTYHDFGVDDDGDLVLVMEYLRGTSLHAVLRSGKPVPVGWISRAMSQAASGLAAAHRTGIIHRDIKPSNLFVADRGTADERVKVIDFGILRRAERFHEDLRTLTQANTFVGTPAYCAPEMLLGKPLDARADQYALALVAFELLEGRRAFPGNDTESLMERLTKRPTDLEFVHARRPVPGSAGNVLHRALSPDPASRFDDVGAFATALEGALSGAADDPDSTRVMVPVTDLKLTPEANAEAREEPLPDAPLPAVRAPGLPDRTRVDRPVCDSTEELPPSLPFAARPAPVGGAEAAAGVPPVSLMPPAVRSRRGPWTVFLVLCVAVGLAAWMAAGAFIPVVESGGAAPDPSSATDTISVSEPTSSAAQTSVDIAEPNDVVVATERDLNVAPPVPERPRGGAITLLRSRRPAAVVGVRPPAGGTGRITLNADPWAEVILDRKPVGKTPILGLEVSEGRHHVLFRHPQHGSREEWITVKAGETVSRSARLSGGRPPEPRSVPQ